jgi:RNA polymerase sigma-70 factor, ECF subfamily
VSLLAGAPDAVPRPAQVSGPWDRLDDAVVAVSAADNPEAFGVLYDRYCDHVYRAAYRRLQDRREAEDATAQTFFTALRSIGTYRPQAGPFPAWLHQIAVTTITDHLRARTSPLHRPPRPCERASDRP